MKINEENHRKVPNPHPCWIIIQTFNIRRAGRHPVPQGVVPCRAHSRSPGTVVGLTQPVMISMGKTGTPWG